MIAEVANALFETTLATSAAALLVLCLRGPLMKRFGAGVGYAAWALVPIAWLAVLLPASRAPAMQTTTLRGATAGQIGEALSTTAIASLPWQPLLLVVWALGAAASVALFWLQQRRFQRQLAGSEPRADGLRVARATAGLPTVVGVLRPRIVLPADFQTRYSEAERELILCHERIHVARRDLQANAVAAGLRALYWFNPLMHCAAQRFRRDQELACDARVVARHPGRRRTYAAAMLKTQLAVSPLPLACRWQDSVPLKERIEMLKEHAPKPLRSLAGAAIVSLLFVAGGYAAWAAQPAKPVDPRPAARVDIASKNTNPPRYPVDAAHGRVEGRVVLVVDVAADGSVEKLVVEKSEPAGVFDAAVLDAASKWRFEPARENGKPVAGRVRVPVDFSMDQPQDKAGAG